MHLSTAKRALALLISAAVLGAVPAVAQVTGAHAVPQAPNVPSMQSPAPQGTDSGMPQLSLRPSGFTDSPPPEYRLGPMDIINITVYNMPELNRSGVVLGTDGALHVRFLSRPVPATGLTASELAEAIREALQDQQILVDPQVDVTVIRIQSEPLIVMGDVRDPTTIQATGSMTLLQALMMAGGPATSAGGTVIISHPPAPLLAPDAEDNAAPAAPTAVSSSTMAAVMNAFNSGTPVPAQPAGNSTTQNPVATRPAAVAQSPAAGTVSSSAAAAAPTEPAMPPPVRLSLAKVMTGTDPSARMILHGGDFVRVIAESQVYAMGDFGRPGAYGLPASGNFTLTELLSESGGWGADAKPGSMVIVHHEENGDTETIRVDASKVIHRKAPDVQLAGGDIIYLQNSTLRGLGLFTLRAVGVAAATAIGYLLIQSY